MNIAIVYYSYSGNTHKAAKIMEETLSANNSVKCLRVEAPSESNNFFVQCLRAFVKRKVEIAPIEADLAKYDLIIFASPVWAGEMAPAMRTYLEKIGTLSGKTAVIFVTYGSGLGKERCLDSLKNTIEAKGASCIGRFSLSQFKVNDETLIKNLLNHNVRLSSASRRTVLKKRIIGRL